MESGASRNPAADLVAVGPLVGSRRAAIARRAKDGRIFVGLMSETSKSFKAISTVPPGEENEAIRQVTARLIAASDPQRQRVYDWERDCVEPSARELLSREDCRDMIARAASRLYIPMPSLRFVKRRVPCKAIPAEWAIQIADWGRERVTLLHETAHLATVDQVRAGEAAHGPCFVRTAIDLYAMFTKLAAERMEAEATRRGIEVAPGIRSKGRANSPFFADEF